jgi:hypothetical protein
MRRRESEEDENGIKRVMMVELIITGIKNNKELGSGTGSVIP